MPCIGRFDLSDRLLFCSLLNLRMSGDNDAVWNRKLLSDGIVAFMKMPTSRKICARAPDSVRSSGNKIAPDLFFFRKTRERTNHPQTEPQLTKTKLSPCAAKNCTTSANSAPLGPNDFKRDSSPPICTPNTAKSAKKNSIRKAFLSKWAYCMIARQMRELKHHIQDVSGKPAFIWTTKAWATVWTTSTIGIWATSSARKALVQNQPRWTDRTRVRHPPVVQILRPLPDKTQRLERSGNQHRQRYVDLISPTKNRAIPLSNAPQIIQSVRNFMVASIIRSRNPDDAPDSRRRDGNLRYFITMP